MHAVVPVKSLTRAKVRLAPLLGPIERRDLALAMLNDVLHLLATCQEIEAVWVVTADQVAADLATRTGAGWIRDTAGSLNGAVEQAASSLATSGVAGMLVIPSDVPLLTRSDVCTMATPHAASGITIAPSHDNAGTNALALWPPQALPPGFGAQSYVTHLRAALIRGLPVSVYRSATLGLDIDTPADLQRLVQADLPPATRAALHHLRDERELAAMAV